MANLPPVSPPLAYRHRPMPDTTRLVDLVSAFFQRWSRAKFLANTSSSALWPPVVFLGRRCFAAKTGRAKSVAAVLPVVDAAASLCFDIRGSAAVLLRPVPLPRSVAPGPVGGAGWSRPSYVLVPKEERSFSLISPFLPLLARPLRLAGSLVCVRAPQHRRRRRGPSVLALTAPPHRPPKRDGGNMGGVEEQRSRQRGGINARGYQRRAKVNFA